MFLVQFFLSDEQVKKLWSKKRVLVSYKKKPNYKLSLNEKNYKLYMESIKRKNSFFLLLSEEELSENFQNKRIKTPTKKGKMCSVEGNKYEKNVYNIVKKCKINNELFNTQEEWELAGSSSKNDIICNFEGNNVNTEIKKCNSPDWMQCSIKKENGVWIPKDGKNSKECKMIFYNLIKDRNLYNGSVPPFFERNITHKEWTEIKKDSTLWNDIYFDIPSDTIQKLYSSKGCHYIQLSDFGLYHLGNDICNFGVPYFQVEQQIRIRTKVHQSVNREGFCNLSVMMAAKPVHLNNLQPSLYSLDDSDKLPPSLSYNDNLG